MKVLIADDSPLVRALLISQLEADGLELFEAADGVEALEVAKQKRPNVILADHDMPNLDGVGVCQSVRSDPELARIPVLVLTGSRDPEVHKACLEAGAKGVLGKNDDPAELLAAILRVTASAT